MLDMIYFAYIYLLWFSLYFPLLWYSQINSVLFNLIAIRVCYDHWLTRDSQESPELQEGLAKGNKCQQGATRTGLAGKGKRRNHRKTHAWKYGVLLQKEGIKNSELRWIQFFNRNELGPVYKQILIQTTNRRK